MNRYFNISNLREDMQSTSRKSTRVYAKGAIRREALLDAASDLLADQELSEISLKDIAAKAQIPVGSAYHFFANAQDVFVALAQRFMNTLYAIINEPYSGVATNSWQNLFNAAIDRAASLYDRHPAYRQLIISGKAAPEIKLADRENDERVSQLMIAIINRHFQIENLPFNKDIFFFTTEIVDLMFSLSVIRHGVITPDMLAEAKKAGMAYLLLHLPEEIPAN